MKNKFNIVIVNYKTSDMVLDLVSHLLLDSQISNIFIVENASPDDSFDILNSKLEHKLQNDNKIIFTCVHEREFHNLNVIDYEKKNVVLVKAEVNKGFAYGNNIVLSVLMEAKENDKIWLLNPDTLPLPNSINSIYNESEENDNSIIGSVLVDLNNKVQCIGGSRLNKFLGIPIGIGKGLDYDVSYDYTYALANHSLDFINGASMILSVKTLRKLGVMPDEYFLYWEEADWCTRAKQKNISLKVCCKSHILHNESASVGLRTKYQYKIDMRNTIKFYSKYYKIYIPVVMLIKPVINVISFCRKERSFSIKPLYWSLCGLFGKL